MGSNFIGRCAAAAFERFLACSRELKRPVQRNRWWSDWSGRHWSDSEAPSKQHFEPCIRCGSKSAIRARVLGNRVNGPSAFIPEGCRSSGFWIGVRFYDSPFFACLDCGLVWSQVDPEDVRRHVEKYGDATKSPAKAFDEL